MTLRHFLFVIFLSALYYSANAATLNVGSGQAFESIREALQHAGSGDTVVVHEGTYREGALKITKTVVLKGKGYPTIDGENKYEMILVLADSVVVEGFRIINSGSSSTEDYAGVKFSGVKGVTVRNNILENNFFGIYSENSIGGRIENNKILSSAISEHASGNGIHCWKSDQMVIVGNTIEKHRDGIYFEFVTNSIITRNVAKHNIRYGLHFMFSNDDAYIQNYFESNGAGVAVMYSKVIRMVNNYFIENWGDAAYGIYLKEINDGFIHNNLFQNNTTAVVMEGSNRIHMLQNNVRNNGWGFRIQASCSDVIVEQNNFVGNTFDAATNGTLVLNTFKENYWDKYEGYDLDKDGMGDVPYRPLSLFSIIVEKNPSAMILFRSFMITLLEKSEKALPSLTPDNFIDNSPRMSAF